MNDTIKQIQSLLVNAGYDPGPIDGLIGPKTRKATDSFYADQGMIQMGFSASVEGAGSLPDDKTVHRGLASSFADPADVAAFYRHKQMGMTDAEAFRYGDNAVGVWGDRTDSDQTAMCALPPEDWHPYGSDARGKKVLVSANGVEVTCELRDTMPAKKHITNGAIIDLNPAACKALGVKPPILIACAWQWSGERGSNPRQAVWKTAALPTELPPQIPERIGI